MRKITVLLMRKITVLMRALIMLAVAFAFAGRPSLAQEFSETLADVGEGYAAGYLAPLMDVVGANFNAGLVPAAQVGSDGNELNVYIGVKAFGAFVPQNAKTFSTTYVGSIPIEQKVGSETIQISAPAEFAIEDAPTFFGDSDPGAMMVHAQHDTTFSYLGMTLPVSIDTTRRLRGIGGLWSASIAPFLVPEVGVGTFLGTDVMARWVPRFSVQNSESIYLIGFGVRHRLNPYLPRLGLDVAVQAVWQRAGADDDEGNPLVRVSTFAGNVQVGKRLGLLGVYAAVQAEQSNAEIRYLHVPESLEADEFDDGSLDEDSERIPVRFNLAGSGKMRGILGIDLALGMLHLNADVGIGRIQTISAGIAVMY